MESLTLPSSTLSKLTLKQAQQSRHTLQEVTEPESSSEENLPDGSAFVADQILYDDDDEFNDRESGFAPHESSIT